MDTSDFYCTICHSNLHGEDELPWHLLCALITSKTLGRESEYWRIRLDAHFEDLLSQATSVQILDAYLSALRPDMNPLYGDILVMEMVTKQDDERDSGLDPTGACDLPENEHDV